MPATTTHTGVCIEKGYQEVRTIVRVLNSTIAHIDFTSTIIRRRENHV